MATVIRGDRKDIDPAEDAAAKVESDIREFVRRDQFAPRRIREERNTPRESGLPGATPLAGTQGAPVNTQHNHDINDLIRRVSGGSMEEIDKVILELQSVRDMLRSEGERVSREIAGYASLNAAAMTAMEIIAESMTQWKAQPTNRDHDS